VTLDDGGHERLLAGEILVERADAHPRHLRNAVGAGIVETMPDENASGRLNQRVHRRARTFLSGGFPGFCDGSARHFSTPSMRVSKANDCSYFAGHGHDWQ